MADERFSGDMSRNEVEIDLNKFMALLQEKSELKDRIRELEEVLSVSQVVEYKTMGVEDRVIFGSTVTIKDLESEEIKTYQIVGDAEADIERNTISFTTPMARSLIKKELGEFVEVETPGGVKEYEITEIKLI